MKKDYKMSFFRKLDPANNYFWKWTPSVGKSGGILCEIKIDSLDVNVVNHGKYILQFVVWDKKCNWALIVVYGAPHEANKPEFLTELASFYHLLMPYIVGGDYKYLKAKWRKEYQLCEQPLI
jgi:hypothetical protein